MKCSSILMAGGFVALLAGTLASGVEAAPASITVTLSGEAYDGPPKFQVKFGGKIIGSGAVGRAIDTATDGQLTGVRSIEPFLESFEFAVPEAVFTAQGALEIGFLNDAWGGQGTLLDRNLLIAKVVVNGRERMIGDFLVSHEGEQVPQDFYRGMLLLRKTGETATIEAPEGGWAEPAEVAVAKPETSAPAPTCEPGTLAVTDFERGVIGVPETQVGLLGDFAAGLPSKLCAVTVTGYSSLAGPPDVNKLLSGARAEAVLALLLKRGAEFVRQEVVAFGETNQFGEAAEANQRVVVSVGP